MVMNTDGMERVIDRAVELAEADREAVRNQFEGVPLGHTTVDDETFAAAVELKLAQHPPVPVQFPDGTIHIVSPFMLMLGADNSRGKPLVDGGREVLTRYEKARGLRDRG